MSSFLSFCDGMELELVRIRIMIFILIFSFMNNFINNFVKRMWSNPQIDMSYKSVIIIKTIRNLLTYHSKSQWNSNF